MTEHLKEILYKNVEGTCMGRIGSVPFLLSYASDASDKKERQQREGEERQAVLSACQSDDKGLRPIL